MTVSKFFMIAIVVLALSPRAARGHDSPSGWRYPPGCCGGRDCKPVPCDQLVETEGGWLYLPNHTFFHEAQVQPSQDRFCHVCIGYDWPRVVPHCAFIQNGV